jgi:hypothetical protein
MLELLNRQQNCLSWQMRDNCDQFGHDALLKVWISTKPLAELCQVFEINGATDQQDLVCLALSALLQQGGGRISTNAYVQRAS